jgi:D-alanyl-D-alanine carboxypeptidase (penicillin-binding protein 5/6)
VARYTIERGHRKDRRKRHLALTLLNIGVLIGVGGFLWQHRLNTNHGADRALAYSNQKKLTALLPWPNYGQSAYGVSGSEIVAVSSDQNKPVPIASLAKVITALAVLQAKPLAPGTQGPMITLSQRDVEIFSSYVVKNGTVVPVEAGEQISELQALQAMLMPSANNMADSLAIWAFGSMQAYTTYANGMIKDLGLRHTTVADASGFSPSTTSTAQDMVQLGILYMKNIVLQTIARQEDAEVPVAGKIPNYNKFINKDGLVGIKVGDTDEAGRCFMLANVKRHGNSTITSVAVVLGAPHISIAASDASTIIAAGDKAYAKLSTSQ